MLKTTDEIIKLLIKRDSCFISLYRQYGLIEHSIYRDIYFAVVFQIVGQMLSKSVSNKIFSRLEVLCGHNICAENMIKLSREDLRKCGMAYSKADYILHFSEQYLNKEFCFDNIDSLSDEDLIRYLRRIKGVGLWTAEMLALFTFGRENIFSYDDVALKNGIMKVKGYKSLSRKRFESLRKRYSPYCSFAALYFYRVNDESSVSNL